MSNDTAPPGPSTPPAQHTGGYQPPGPARLLRLVRVTHPFPSLLNAVAGVALAAVALGGAPGWTLALRLALTMLAAQCTIGIVNDLVDRDLDAATKPWKPLAAGLLSRTTARALATVTGAAALILGMTLGPWAWLLSTLGMAVGLAYDLRLKRTAWSWVTYAVALPLVPLWVWTAAGRFTPALLWVIPVGLLLGASLQIANALPDMEGDGAYGVRGAAQHLGRGGALAAAWGGYLLAVLVASGIGLLLGHQRPLLLGGAGAALVLLAISIGAWALRPGAAALQLGWSLLAPGAGLLAVCWLAALR